jgi:hypothetical protein
MKKKNTKHKRPAQSLQIMKYLATGKPITAIQALNKFGCFRLAARIHEMRSEGLAINEKTINKNGKRFSQYQIA